MEAQSWGRSARTGARSTAGRQLLCHLQSLKSLVRPPQGRIVEEVLYSSYFASSMNQKALRIAEDLAAEKANEVKKE